mmetsp:Transcript_105425/g.308217  ORF Transcript_105425/g.308217 Transcript_105425/m.308217 type:complete len:254 (-) Transcript_105425:1581-2342(-)
MSGVQPAGLRRVLSASELALHVVVVRRGEEAADDDEAWVRGLDAEAGVGEEVDVAAVHGAEGARAQQHDRLPGLAAPGLGRGREVALQLGVVTARQRAPSARGSRCWGPEGAKARCHRHCVCEQRLVFAVIEKPGPKRDVAAIPGLEFLQPRLRDCGGAIDSTSQLPSDRRHGVRIPAEIGRLQQRGTEAVSRPHTMQRHAEAIQRVAANVSWVFLRALGRIAEVSGLPIPVPLLLPSLALEQGLPGLADEAA